MKRLYTKFSSLSDKTKYAIGVSAMLFFAIIFIWSACNLLSYFNEYRKLNETYEEAQGFVQIETTPSLPIDSIVADETHETEETHETLPIDEYQELKIDIDVDWDTLFSQSDDVIGWLYIPESNINYPLMQRDNLYYLDHDYKGNYNIGGSIFLDARLDMDVQNVIIYGHNMKSGTMFHELHSYAKQEYADEHKYIYIATRDDTRLYQVFSAAYTIGGSETYTWSFDDNGGMAFEEYVNKSIAESVVMTDVREIIEGDKLITLSTCNGQNAKNRLVVQAVLLTTY